MCSSGSLRVKPAPFQYEAASSLDHACELLAQDPENTKVLAGGQSLAPLLNLRLARPTRIVDLGRIGGELNLIARTAEGLRIGAMARQRTVERSAIASAACPLLSEALPWVGHPTTRNRGTIGGSLAHADPAAELPAVAVALNARLKARSVRGERHLEAGSFYRMFLTTELEPDEILVEVVIPDRGSRCGTAWLEFAQRHGDYAIVGVATLLELGRKGEIAAARLVYAGIGGTPTDASGAADGLLGEVPVGSLFRSVAKRMADSLTPSGELGGSSDYKRQLVRVLTERALSVAARRAVEGDSREG